jgi:hypothetical protein
MVSIGNDRGCLVIGGCIIAMRGWISMLGKKLG